MTRFWRLYKSTGFFLSLTILGIGLGSMGCAIPNTMPVIAQRYRIEVNLDPVSHRLTGRAVIDVISPLADQYPADQPVAIELELHPNLRITSLRTGGPSGKLRGVQRGRLEPDGTIIPSKHLVVIDRPTPAMTLFVDYSGKLEQNVSAGEVAGKIHNHSVKAHIGMEGVFLSEGSWYPSPADDDRLAPSTADYFLLATPIPGMVLRASADRDQTTTEQTGRLAWRSRYPMDGLALVGGPHEVTESEHHGLKILTHLKSNQRQYADGLIHSITRYLDRYEPLIGPYPADEFAIVDNFFSSGFAFPTFTLLSSAVIEMGERSQTTHGYIDHEFLHSWWGNGIFVDPRDGNWCEALTSYATNYYGYVLDGKEDEARRKRRNYSHFLSRIKPEHDKPLGTYGLEDGCGRGIAYSKGTMVFHMLARKMGQENFWLAMRKMTADYVGRHVSWNDIQRICEEVSGVDLEIFIQQWVRRGGAPALAMDSAIYHSGEQTLTITMVQGDIPFDLEVPIRITHATGTEDLLIPLRMTGEEISFPVNVVPLTVELDPDYQLFRKIDPEDRIPTTATSRRGEQLVVVYPQEPMPDRYRQLGSLFESGRDDLVTLTRTAGLLEEGVLAERSVLVIGGATRDPYITAFLRAVDFPIQFDEAGFVFDAQRYDDPSYAVLCTMAHPGAVGGGVTVVVANSEQAIPSPINIPMYDRSLVIFENGKPILRHDFEQRIIITVGR